MRFLSLSSTRDFRAVLMLRFAPVPEDADEGAFASFCGGLEGFWRRVPWDGLVLNDCIV